MASALPTSSNADDLDTTEVIVAHAHELLNFQHVFSSFPKCLLPPQHIC